MDELEQRWPDPDRREEALVRMLARVVEPRPSPTASELLTLRAVASGLTEAEAAVVLGVSMATVHDRLTRCRRCLQAKTTTQAVAVALRLDLIP